MPNLHSSYCPWCRKFAVDPVELGTADRVYLCPTCNTQFLDAAWPKPCPSCGTRQTTAVRRLQPDEAVAGVLCLECQAKQDSMKQTVREGGVLFRCRKCGVHGVIAADVQFAKDIRLKVGKAAPEEVGVEIEDCPRCTPEEPANMNPSP